MTKQNLTSITANTRVVSVREKSVAALTQAIHSPGDEEYTLGRTRTCLKLYFDPDMSAADRADMIDAYARALSSFPKWAVAQAFDKWEREKTHRPSPAGLAQLASAALKRMTDEVARRKKAQEEQTEREPLSEQQKLDAALIGERAGFTAKRAATLKARPMLGSFAEADAVVDKPRQPHWTATEAPDSPKMRDLQKARDGNALIAEARAARGAVDHG